MHSSSYLIAMTYPATLSTFFTFLRLRFRLTPTLIRGWLCLGSRPLLRPHWPEHWFHIRYFDRLLGSFIAECGSRRLNTLICHPNLACPRSGDLVPTIDRRLIPGPEVITIQSDGEADRAVHSMIADVCQFPVPDPCEAMSILSCRAHRDQYFWAGRLVARLSSFACTLASEDASKGSVVGGGEYGGFQSYVLQLFSGRRLGDASFGTHGRWGQWEPLGSEAVFICPSVWYRRSCPDDAPARPRVMVVR